MTDDRALGDYPAFSRWGDRKPWGSGSVKFGAGVFDDMVAGLEEFTASGLGEAAIGCVPWLTDRRFAARLAQLEAVCIVVDKGASQSAANKLMDRDGRDFPIQALGRLDLMVTPMGGQDVGPLRVAGQGERRRPAGREKRPLVHTKILVLGDLAEHEYDSGVGEWTEWRFDPKRAWIGSANWSYQSGRHLEVGLWIDDPELVTQTTELKI